MRHLEVALKVETNEESRSLASQSGVRCLNKREKWSLDPDFIEEGPEGGRQRFAKVAREILSKKFLSEKYIEEETFRQMLAELMACLPYIQSELQRFRRIEETLQDLGQYFFGEMKNYIKHFQSLLDAKIRKIKRRTQKPELREFERMAGEGKSSKPMHRKQGVLYIDEEERDTRARNKYRDKHSDRIESGSKKSFGTVESGASNENESGSGKNYSGSDSKSGEANALAVLLANVSRVDEKKIEKGKENKKQDYDFSSVLGANITVRQRSPTPNLSSPSISKQPEPSHRAEAEIESDKDEAFIFHRPKANRRTRF